MGGRRVGVILFCQSKSSVEYVYFKKNKLELTWSKNFRILQNCRTNPLCTKKKTVPSKQEQNTTITTRNYKRTIMVPKKQAERPNFWKLPFGDHGRVPYGITVHVIGSQGWSRHCVFTTCHVWPCLVDTFKNSLLAAISTSLWKATSFDKINVIHINFKKLSAPSKKVVSKAFKGPLKNHFSSP